MKPRKNRVNLVQYNRWNRLGNYSLNVSSSTIKPIYPNIIFLLIKIENDIKKFITLTHDAPNTLLIYMNI